MITGTGTQADPYIVDTWEDFVTAAGTSGAYVKIAEGVVFDMNAIAPEGAPAVTVAAAHIDGKGATIEAARVNTAFLNLAESTKTIENLKITSFTATAPVIAKTTDDTCTLKNVILAGIQNGSHTLWCNPRGYLSFTSNEIASCGFTVKVNEGSFMYDPARITFTDCDFIMEGGNIGDGYAIFPTCINCGIFGKVGIVYLSDASQFVTVNAVADSVTISRAGRKILANSDLCASIGGNATPVTDAQMRDPEYLSSIGFPIGVQP